MFTLRNTWMALLRRKWLTLIMMIVVVLLAFATVFAVSVAHAADEATGAGYAAQKPSAVIRPTSDTSAKRNGSDSSWTKNYLSWNDYTTYATAAQEKSLQFTYSFLESVPVRQTSSFKSVAGTADDNADKTGGEFTVRAMYSAEAWQANDFGTHKLVSGKELDYTSTTETSQALLSQTVADDNGLKVGDTFEVANPADAKKTIKLTVHGIYTYTDEARTGEGSDATLAKDNRENAIYVNYPTFAEQGLDPTNGKGWAIPDLNVLFIFSSTADYSTFVNLAKQAKLPDTLEISSPTLTAYEASISPLKALNDKTRLAQIMLWAVGGLLMLALVAAGMRGRSGEIGTGLIVGVSRARLGWQFMLEVLVPTLPALAVGMVAGGFASGPLGSALTQGHATAPTTGIIGQIIWYALAATVVLAIIAAQRVVWFRSTSLFQPRQEVTA